MPRRRVLAPVVAAALALALAGCIPLPGAVPATSAPATSTQPSSTPSATPDASPEPSSPAPSADEPAGDASGPFTVDDGAGDTWTYTVVGYELPTQIESGAVPEGMEAVSLVLDATHDEGSAAFSTCFEVQVVTDSGTYSTLDDASLSVTAVDDVYGLRDSFTGGRAIVAVPAGTTTGTFVVISRFGDDVREFPFAG